MSQVACVRLKTNPRGALPQLGVVLGVLLGLACAGCPDKTPDTTETKASAEPNSAAEPAGTVQPADANKDDEDAKPPEKEEKKDQGGW
jgi:hypothetical protein